MERTKMPNLRNGNKEWFEPGLTWLRVWHSTTELPRSLWVLCVWCVLLWMYVFYCECVCSTMKSCVLLWCYICSACYVFYWEAMSFTVKLNAFYCDVMCSAGIYVSYCDVMRSAGYVFYWDEKHVIYCKVMCSTVQLVKEIWHLLEDKENLE